MTLDEARDELLRGLFAAGSIAPVQVDVIVTEDARAAIVSVYVNPFDDAEVSATFDIADPSGFDCQHVAAFIGEGLMGSPTRH